MGILNGVFNGESKWWVCKIGIFNGDFKWGF